MTQVDRDRLVTLRKAKKRLITQKQAARIHSRVRGSFFSYKQTIDTVQSASRLRSFPDRDFRAHHSFVGTCPR
jgi:hypothetical protein